MLIPFLQIIDKLCNLKIIFDPKQNLLYGYELINRHIYVESLWYLTILITFYQDLLLKSCQNYKIKNSIVNAEFVIQIRIFLYWCIKRIRSHIKK